MQINLDELLLLSRRGSYPRSPRAGPPAYGGRGSLPRPSRVPRQRPAGARAVAPLRGVAAGIGRGVRRRAI